MRLPFPYPSKTLLESVKHAPICNVSLDWPLRIHFFGGLAYAREGSLPSRPSTRRSSTPSMAASLISIVHMYVFWGPQGRRSKTESYIYIKYISNHEIYDLRCVVCSHLMKALTG